MKYLEWAHSFAGSGGVGVASISKQQAYKTNLSEAVSTVRSCAKLAKQQIVQRAQKRKAAGSGQRRSRPPRQWTDAFAAVQAAGRQAGRGGRHQPAVCEDPGLQQHHEEPHREHLTGSHRSQWRQRQWLERWLQGLGRHQRQQQWQQRPKSQQQQQPAPQGAGPVQQVGSMAAPAAPRPTRKLLLLLLLLLVLLLWPALLVAGGAGVVGPSPGESGTQNSASSAIELVPVAAEGSSRATDRADLADGVQDYLTLTGKSNKGRGGGCMWYNGPGCSVNQCGPCLAVHLYVSMSVCLPGCPCVLMSSLAAVSAWPCL